MTLTISWFIMILSHNKQLSYCKVAMWHVSYDTYHDSMFDQKIYTVNAIKPTGTDSQG